MINIVNKEELIAEKKRREEKFEYLKEPDFSKIQTIESMGWTLVKKYKTYAKFKRERVIPYDEQFENEVWLLFFRLGFFEMNKGRFFKLPYSSQDEKLTQQIDVFAADDESIVIVECKSTTRLEKHISFKTDIEAIHGKMQGLMASARKLFPDKKLKVKFVFATKNYALSKEDKDRMAEYKIAHFDEDTIKYYYELLSHIGLAARYQLLGNLFEGQKIPGMNNVVPAIQGKMGSQKKYYSFSIEPEKLLKMGFVLHHDNAYKDEMPAYQRIIKANRLKAVREFIENGGYFPNSVIISINDNNLKFDLSPLQDENSLSKIGLLHLPQSYKSVFIIDGQHRLYGYSGSKWANKNSIPVVAFENLEKEEQIQLFMDINENQKSVPKNLRTTLESDLLWNSDDYNKRRKAISSRIAQRLGEQKNSALYGRIITGENTSTPYRAITLDIICRAIKESDFYNTYKNNVVIKDGIIDKGDCAATLNLLEGFLMGCFDRLEDTLGQEEWQVGINDDNSILSNTFIYGFIKVFSDILKYLKDKGQINPKQDKVEVILDSCTPYLDCVSQTVQNISTEERRALRKKYGRVGDVRFWRMLQLSLNEKYNDFEPDGLKAYWQDNSKQYNEEAYKIIRDIELYLKETVVSKLSCAYGDKWFRAGCPKAVYDAANKLASDKNYEKADNTPDALPEDQLHLIDYRSIITYASNWQEYFEKIFADPNVKGDKQKRTEWMKKLNDIRNQNFHTYSIKQDEFEYIKGIKEWLLK